LFKQKNMIIAVALIVGVVAGFGVAYLPSMGVSPVKPSSYVVLSTWVIPADDYGQYVESVYLYQNSSGSWVLVHIIDSDHTDVLEVPIGCSLKVIVYSWLNSTLTGSGSSTAGKLHQRHNVNVTNLAESSIFFKQNMTFTSVDTGIDPPLWLYGYSQILNFETLPMESYAIEIIYETFW